MSEAQLCILVCSSLVLEVETVVTQENWTGLKIITFSSECGRPAKNQQVVGALLEKYESQFEHFLVLGGSCLTGTLKLEELQFDGKLTQIPRCVDLMLPQPIIQMYTREGQYLLTSGWLQSWREKMKVWQFEQEMAREFFAESCSGLTLLDSGLYPDSEEQLLSFSRFVDRPAQTVPVGLDMLRLNLAVHLKQHRKELLTAQKDIEQKASLQLADYALAFDLMGPMTECESKATVTLAIFTLFEMITSARTIAFLDGSAGEVHLNAPDHEMSQTCREKMLSLTDSFAWLESGTGFMLQLNQGENLIGVLLIDQIGLPENKEQYLNFALSIRPVLVMTISNARNIEKRQLREQELEKIKAELESFTYRVAHDLKSPLVTIQGFTGILEMSLKDCTDNDILSNLSHIKSSSLKMYNLISELLELSRMGKAVSLKEIVCISEVAQDALVMVKGLVGSGNITIEIADNLPKAKGDSLRLREVMQNLLENAINYMGQSSDPHIEVGVSEVDGGQACYVRDNGIGILPQHHEKVFGLFERISSDSKGTGIGLAKVRRIIELHGGRVWIESTGELGEGTTFWFTLPWE